MKKELEKLLSKLNDTIDWSAKELPDIAKQLIKWEIVEDVIAFIFTLIPTIITILLFKAGLAWKAPRDYYGTDVNFSLVGGIILGIITIIILYNIINNFVRVLVAPKVFLIERITSYINK